MQDHGRDIAIDGGDYTHRDLGLIANGLPIRRLVGAGLARADSADG
jgi:hypothetical protein